METFIGIITAIVIAILCFLGFKNKNGITSTFKAPTKNNIDKIKKDKENELNKKTANEVVNTLNNAVTINNVKSESNTAFDTIKSKHRNKRIN